MPRVVSVPVPAKRFGKDALDDFTSRQSKELVIGLSGPIGSGLSEVKAVLEQCLGDRGYSVKIIKVSALIDDEASRRSLHDAELSPLADDRFARVWRLQNLGNKLRERLGEDIGAQLAMRAIAVDRAKRNPGKDINEIEPSRVAYIIDQLKHPKEVALLRSVYGNLFFMIGVLASHAKRRRTVEEMIGRSDHFADQLIERDRKDSEDNGQQLDKTLQYAEFFINNSNANVDRRREAVKRFLGLIHGDNGYTPTPKERGMFAAYTASLRSACLSRQVGASIMDVSGNLLATGCNDVPRAGGGLYEPGANDMRCVVRDEFCHNDKHKAQLRDDVARVLQRAGIEFKEAVGLADRIRKETRIKDLIEFSRAVHAEMDAIVSVARTGSAKVANSIMFTTTYPCHSCARHIVAAGVKVVYFIEPYEKSLAVQLHNDAIVQDPEAELDWARLDESSVVSFVHFEGVAPHRYTKLFEAVGSRKGTDGMALRSVPLAGKRIHEYLDDYKELEARVVARLQALDEGGSADGLDSEDPTAA